MRMETMLTKAIRFFDRIVVLCAWPGKLAAWLCIAIIGLSLVSSVTGLFRMHTFLRWTEPVFLFGTELNSSSVQELQWHFFSILMLFTASYTYSLDGHVRVDILYGKLSDRGKLWVNFIGDTFFLLPFAVSVVWYSLDLVRFSYITHESSPAMGLTHRYLVKSLLPIGMGLLCIQAAARSLSGFFRIVAPGAAPLPRNSNEDEGGRA